MKKWHSTEQFRHVFKYVRWEYIEREHAPGKMPTLDFFGTVKLHGTNCGVKRTPEGEFVCQSRRREISVGDDNNGFARFISELPEDVLHQLFDDMTLETDCPVTLFGEWIGPGIQCDVAINKLEQKLWVIFGCAIQKSDEETIYVQNNASVENEEYNVFNVLSAPTFDLTIDFNNPEAVDEEITELVKQVNKQCPFGEMLGCEGAGEGIVWQRGDRMTDADSWFKSVGEIASPRKRKTAASVDLEVVENINKCVDLILTDRRLEQGVEYLNEQNLDIDMPSMGPFLKWVSQDCQKEESDLIDSNGFVWKDVVKEIQKRARTYFMDIVNKDSFRV